MRLRLASLSDCLRVWRWRNEKEVRVSSFNTAKIPYTSHRQWFSKKLADPAAKLLIAVIHKDPIGQVRLDLLGRGAAEIHILIKKAARNRGYGTALLKTSARYAFRTLAVSKLYAYIRPENRRSLRAFEKAGFKVKRSRKVHSQKACELILVR